jgi:hypothetical protein
MTGTTCEPSGTLQDTPEAVVKAALEAGARAWAGVAKNATEVHTPIPPVPVLPAATAAAACALDLRYLGRDPGWSA